MMLTPFFTPERIFLLYCAVGGFIIGQLQFSFFFSKLKKKDLRHHGTGSYGAENAFRVLGAPLGILTFLLDFGKTVLAIYIASRVLPMHPELVIDFHALVLYTGLGVVLGHIFPVYLKFNGGKGFSCTLATFLCLQDIKLIGVVILVFLVMFLVSRYVSLSSMVTVFFGAISFMFFMLMRWTYVETDWIFDCQCVLVLLFIFSLIAHRSNIVRLVFGDERKVYFRKKKRLEALEEDYTNFDKYFDEVEEEESGLASVEAALLSGEANLAGEIPDELTEAAEEAAEEAEEAAEEVVEETAEETIEAETAEAEEGAETEAETEATVEETPESTEEVTESAEETAEEVAEAAEETVEETKETVEGLEEAAEEAVEETAEETAEEVTETAVESVEELEETAEETIEEVTATAEETTEAAEEVLEASEEVAEEVMEETVEEASEETDDTVEKAAAAAIPLAGFFGRIKSLFRKPEQQEEADLFNNEEALEAATEGIPEDVKESADTIEDHLKTKFKDFDITKKVVLSIGGEEEPPVESEQEENLEETAEGETDAVSAGGVFAAGFFGKMKDKLQKVVHPGEKAIPEFLSDEGNETVEETIETIAETTEETVEETTEAAEEAAEVVEETTEAAEEAAEVVEETVEEAAEVVEETAEEIAETLGEVSEEIAEAVEDTTGETVEELTEETSEIAEEATDVVEEVPEAVEETTETFDETAAVVEETVEETSEVLEEATEEITDTVEETADETAEDIAEEVAEDIAGESAETVEETNEEQLTGGVVLPGFFGRMKAKILKSVNLDNWNEDAQEVSEEIEEAADSVFGDEENGEPAAIKEQLEEIADSVEEEPFDGVAGDIAEEPIEAEVEKAPSKFAGFLNRVRSILPNQEEEPETFEEEGTELAEVSDDVSDETAETTESVVDEITDAIPEELTEQESILEDFTDEPKVGFFGKIRDKFRNFDISKKIGLSLNEETEKIEDIKEDLAEKVEDFHEDIQEKVEDIREDIQEKREDLHEEISEKVEDIKDSVEEKVTDFHETVEEKVDGFKENVEEKVSDFHDTIEEKVDDIRHDLEVKQAETKAGIELQAEKVTQDLKEATEEFSDDLKKKSDELIDQTVIPIKKRKLNREARRALASVTFRQKTSEFKFGAKVQLAKWKATAELTADQLKKKQR